MLYSPRRLSVAILAIGLFAIARGGSVLAEVVPSDQKHTTDQVNIVLLRASPGKSEQLGKAIRELIAQTRKEPGCAVIELHQSSEDPNTWMVYERWRGKEALDSHMKQPYVATFLTQFASLSSGPADVRPYEYRN
jgi:quinol monooxygenase YgiN